ncbi:hypothetical protein P879_06892 [Paragonimus westermani]|uniref:Uncharacterized protein n=1 Tax=Paragonimus westermani TaxID=34504 RepID=A0A8T0DB23_9TREM|nr:hypothetical protein P879_06892 [Paragonimus westermani]
MQADYRALKQKQPVGMRPAVIRAQEASGGKEKPRKTAGDAKSKVSKGLPATKTAGKNPGTQQPEPPSMKGGSKLLKRGEEILEEKFIGDEPDNGISHYIILLGFEDPDLLGALCELDVQVDCIIRLKVTDAGRFQELLLKQKAEKVWGSKGAGQTMEEMREEQEKIEAEERKLNSYWHKVNVILRDNPYGPLGNVATLDYRVKSELLPQDFSGTDNRLSFGMKMFDELAAMLYDLMDFRRQWQNYLKHIKVISLPVMTTTKLIAVGNQDTSQTHVTPRQDGLSGNPEEIVSSGVELTKTPETEEVADGFVDMRVYQEVLEGLPVENTSVELVLHAILEQVGFLGFVHMLHYVYKHVNSIATGTLSNSALEDANIESDGMIVSTAKALAKSVEQLILTEEERSLLSKELPLPVKPFQSSQNSSPVLLHPYDLAGYRQHFGCGQVIQPEKLYEAELQLIRTCYPSLKETRIPLTNSDLNVDKNTTSGLQNAARKQNRKESRFQQLLYFADKTGLDPDEFEHCLLELLLESCPLKGVQTVNRTCRSVDSNSFESVRPDSETSKHQINPFDDPYLPFARLASLLLSEEQQETGKRKLSSVKTDSMEANGNRYKRNSATYDSQSLESNAVSQTSRSGTLDGSLSRKTSGILRRPQSSDSRNSQHTSRSQSAVHFELPEAENPAVGSDSDTNDVTDQTNEVNKRELWEILERIQQKNALLAKQQFNGVDGVTGDKGQVNFSRITMTQQFFDQLVQDRIRQRFDEWCIEEPMKTDAMLQRLNATRYEFPSVEVFQRHRDGSRLIFAHHPFDRNLRSNHYSWSQWIHVADIGFRAYLQHVEGHIAPWTKEQEAIYQAQRLSSEIDEQLERERKQHEKETMEYELEQRRARSAKRVAEKEATQKEKRTSSKTSGRGSPMPPTPEGLSTSNETLIQLQQPTTSDFLPVSMIDKKSEVTERKLCQILMRNCTTIRN